MQPPPYPSQPLYSPVPPPPRQGVSTAAIIGLVLGIGCLGLIFVGAILAAILFPVFAQAREKARSISCLSNIKQMSVGAWMYAQDYDNTLPPGARWMDAMRPSYIKNEAVYRCPSVRGGSASPAASSFGYAFNSRVSQKQVKKIASPATTPLVYDSTNLSRNATDPVASLPADPPRHARGNNIGYVDGHAKWRTPAGAPPPSRGSP